MLNFRPLKVCPVRGCKGVTRVLYVGYKSAKSSKCFPRARGPDGQKPASTVANESLRDDVGSNQGSEALQPGFRAEPETIDSYKQACRHFKFKFFWPRPGNGHEMAL